MKALVLAAGQGTRLKPLTLASPKPLCPFFGLPFIDFALYRLDEINQIAVNTHYHANILHSHLNNAYSNKELYISHEPSLRGTGGAVYPLKSWLGGDDCLVYNSDIISDIDILRLIQVHQEQRPLATMVLLESPKEGKTPIYYENDQVVAIGGSHPSAQQSSFTGVHILSDAFMALIPEQSPWSIIDTYQQALRDGAKILAYRHDGYWADLGTPQDLWQGHLDIINHPRGLQIAQDLGVYSLREQRQMQPLKFIPDHQSCISINTAYTAQMPYQSFVDTCDQTIHQPIDQSLVIAKSIGKNGSKGIYRKILWRDIESRF